MQSNATFLEIFFTVVGAVGLVVVITGFPTIIGDLLYAYDRRRKARPLRIVALEVKIRTAWGILRREVGRLITLLQCTGLGAYLCTKPQSGPNNSTSVAGILLALLILWMECDTTAQSIMDRIDKIVLQRIIVGPRKTLDEAIQAEIQHRRRASDPPPKMPEERPGK